MPALGAGLGRTPRPKLKKAVHGFRRLKGARCSVLVLGCARLLTLTLDKACYTFMHLHLIYVYVHLHLDVPVNEHVESVLAED